MNHILIELIVLFLAKEEMNAVLYARLLEQKTAELWNGSGIGGKTKSIVRDVKICGTKYKLFSWYEEVGVVFVPKLHVKEKG